MARQYRQARLTDSVETYQMTNEEFAALEGHHHPSAIAELRKLGSNMGVTTLAFRKAAANHIAERIMHEEFAAVLLQREHVTSLVEVLIERDDLAKALVRKEREMTRELAKERSQPKVVVTHEAMAVSSEGTSQ